MKQRIKINPSPTRINKPYNSNLLKSPTPIGKRSFISSEALETKQYMQMSAEDYEKRRSQIYANRFRLNAGLKDLSSSLHEGIKQAEYYDRLSNMDGAERRKSQIQTQLDYAKGRDDISVSSNEEGHLKTIQDNQEESASQSLVIHDAYKPDNRRLNEIEEDLHAEITESDGSMDTVVAANNLRKHMSRERQEAEVEEQKDMVSYGTNVSPLPTPVVIETKSVDLSRDEFSDQVPAEGSPSRTRHEYTLAHPEGH